ncbi:MULTISPECIES: YsnF/AvaK domain-containing protein [Leclercia]|uniref:YsnF/AvaK domain-containing protein n=1 Tax=Leclercia TaxID=83654 RepID=UPI000D1181E7|nr:MULTISPECIES: YsnF/AvaK domain-containing protein [Leclercia]MCT9846040.1 YsnF/AvaK domain-containing protein [Leclercia adecarboxylata ATCC 23216 = NBRC 102595]MCU6680725.1 YsnF/AvaK domain-containing protein [Leclercia tamurae]PSS47605.1 stress protein [Enterobacter sp. FS01]
MAHEKIVTAFTQPQQAEVAKQKLIAEGVPEDDIDIIAGERLHVEDKEIRHPSFWQRLFGDDVDDNYAAEYSKAIRAGGVLLTARVDEDDAGRIENLLDTYSNDYAVNSGPGNDLYGKNYLGETNDVGNRTQGQPGVNTADPLLDEDIVTNKPLPGDADYVSGGTVSSGVAGRVSDTTSRDYDAPTDYPERVSDDIQANPSYREDDSRETLKLAEEQIDVSKRRVSDGKVRLRRYTVEDEVSRDISLTAQHASVFRSAINEPGYLNDVDWSEKTLEVEESHEEPVVDKTTYVREEVGLRTETTERAETVKDTVRRQEVEVDKNDLDSDLNKTKYPPKE